MGRRRWRATDNTAPGQVGGPKKRLLLGHEDWLYETVAAEPDIALVGLQARLVRNDVRNLLLAIETVLATPGYGPKKVAGGWRNKIAPTSPPSGDIAPPGLLEFGGSHYY